MTPCRLISHSPVQLRAFRAQPLAIIPRGPPHNVPVHAPTNHLILVCGHTIKMTSLHQKACDLLAPESLRKLVWMHRSIMA